VDILGNPVEGAQVILELNQLIGQKTTNTQGVATFTDILKLPGYNMKVGYDRIKKSHIHAGGVFRSQDRGDDYENHLDAGSGSLDPAGNNRDRNNNNSKN